MDSYITEGDKCVTKAREELSKANWFFNRIDKYKAINLLCKAGNSYSLVKEYNKSTSAYLEGLTVVFNSPEISLDYGVCNMAHCYVEDCNKGNVLIDETVNYSLEKKIIPYLQTTQQFNLIIKIYEQIAVNYERFDNLEKSLRHYQLAKLNAEFKNMKCLTINLLKKMAELNIKSDKNVIASANYRECAELSLTVDLLKSQSKLWLLYSLILEIKNLSEEQMKEKIIKYTDLDPTFSNSPEYHLIIALVKAYKINDIEHINKVIANNSLHFNTTILQVLEQLKTN